MRSRFSPAALRAFEAFFLPWRRRRLAAVRIAGLPRALPPDAPLILAANHVSWWDAFTLREVQRILRPRGPIYTLMTERELRRLPFFGMIGAFGVDPERPGSVLEAVRFFAGEARRRPDATLNFFPQGRIWPSHRRPLGFERGVELFARRVAPCTILPVALHHEPLAAPAPTVFVSCGEPVRVDGGRVDAAALEHAVEGEIDRILHFLSTHGEESGARWPGAFERLEPAPVAAWR